MSEPNTDIYKTGERIEVERDGAWVPAVVKLASANGDSLAISFVFPLGMALLRTDGVFTDILTGRAHQVRRAELT